MSQKLLNHNDVLKKFVNIGLHISINQPYLIINDVPYVSSDKTIKYGRIVSQMVLSGNNVNKPQTHVVYFAGDFPCDQSGTRIERLSHGTSNQNMGGVDVNFSFSNKNDKSYQSEYEKVMNYVHLITAPVYLIDPNVSPFNFHLPNLTDIDDEYPFNYVDTNSSRNGTESLNSKFTKQKIAIIGTGGTGSYILDLVSKTQVNEIHLYDDDKFHTHNAFRTPGAASEDDLNVNQYKTDYLHKKYSVMHRGIISHHVVVDIKNLNELDRFDFVFISIDANESKKQMIEYLIERKIPFIDSGISVTFKDNLKAVVRVNLVDQTNSHEWSTVIPISGGDDVYSSNIQFAEINNIAASLSVIMWKKTLGFYDGKGSKNLFYAVDADEIIT